MSCYPRGNKSVLRLLQVTRYFYIYGILLPPHWKRYFYLTSFLLLIFQKYILKYLTQNRTHATKLWFEYLIQIFMWLGTEKHLIKTGFKSKQVSCSCAINKVKWESKCRCYKCLNFRNFAICKNKYWWNFQKLTIRESNYSQNAIFLLARENKYTRKLVRLRIH